MHKGKLLLRVLDDRWVWILRDSNGLFLCQSKRGFRDLRGAIEDFLRQRADHMAVMLCRNPLSE